ncbi:MAG: M48 family metallopeptidase [Bacteroidota bacterium]|uniref:Zn-dependent protease with chaperone function n=1 Tax=Christiangramia flava JLT2011 TaxID=1229726 RepID=A0A1L7I9R7_9FLAO|nr:M48 family metallopeptidase [Christiangramia flava]APU70320.1 Zn-dependent protease with chaperone function [Christiangramia flava JLT2011]MEE2771710.1 M48 family metallopeptidase [Bacteroidota bacterium]OSS37564.1 Zn-dependent protease [Christiangramia flava JLT2011]
MKLKKLFIGLSLVLFMVACKTNPFTGEKNLNFVSNDQLFPASFAQYDQFLEENEVVRNTPEAAEVKRVGNKIVTAAERYLNANGYQGFLEDFEWEFNLVKDDAVNAFAMPGGKTVVYTGIMPIVQDETGLAVVMAHEVAHALADHGAQRMSAAQLQQLGAVAGTVALSGKSEQTQQMFAQFYGLGSTVGVMLPFSRSHESEADRIGLTLMAIAGYNPDEAANLWRRMQAQSDGQAPPEFLSTHPSNQTRINNLEKWAPAAKAEAAKYGQSF